jgi:hypothetical protein
MEGPIRVKELGDMAPKMLAAQASSKLDRLSFEAILGILSSFPSKAMNTKVEDNFVAHNLDIEFALESRRGRLVLTRKGYESGKSRRG